VERKEIFLESGQQVTYSQKEHYKVQKKTLRNWELKFEEKQREI